MSAARVRHDPGEHQEKAPQTAPTVERGEGETVKQSSVVQGDTAAPTAVAPLGCTQDGEAGGIVPCSASQEQPGASAPLPSIRSPRQRRVLLALLAGPQTREQLDRVAGASNAPDVVMKLRRRFGLSLPCALGRVRDLDGHTVERGIYAMTNRDKVLALAITQEGAT